MYLSAETTPALSNLEVLYLFQKLVDDGAPVTEIEWANVHIKSSLPCTVLLVFSDWSPLKFCYLTYQILGNHAILFRLLIQGVIGQVGEFVCDRGVRGASYMYGPMTFTVSLLLYPMPPYFSPIGCHVSVHPQKGRSPAWSTV